MTITLPNIKIRDLLNAHNQLDGHHEVVEQLGQRISVLKPYDFSAKTRWNITKNIKTLRKYVEEANDERDKILKRISEGTNEIDGTKEPEKHRLFSKEVGEIEEIEVEVYGLLELKVTGLLNDDMAEEAFKKSSNPIPSTVLASLAPVLDLFKTEPEQK